MIDTHKNCSNCRRKQIRKPVDACVFKDDKGCDFWLPMEKNQDCINKINNVSKAIKRGDV